MQSYRISEDNKISLLLANLTDNIFYFDIIPFPYKDNYYRRDYVINSQQTSSIAITGDNKYYSIQKPFNNLLISPLLSIKTFPICETGLFKSQKKIIQQKCPPMRRYDNQSSVMINQIDDFVYVYTPIRFKFKQICSHKPNKTRYIEVIPYTIHPIQLYDGCKITHKAIIVNKPLSRNITYDNERLLPGVVFSDISTQYNSIASNLTSGIIATISVLALLASLSTGVYGKKQAQIALKRIYNLISLSPPQPSTIHQQEDKHNSMPILSKPAYTDAADV